MRTLGFFIYKELLQIFRNRAMLPLLFLVPLVQLLVLSHVATNEVRNLKLAVQDNDHDPLARRLVDKLVASGYFSLASLSANEARSNALLDRDEADLVLVIPPRFGRELRQGKAVEVQLLANAINAMKAGVAVSYAGNIVADYQRELLEEGRIGPGARLAAAACAPGLDLRYQHWFNPELDYKTFMVPGILAVLVSMLALLLGAMNVVREREIGTQEQIAVTPVKGYIYISGKLLPFLLIGLVELTIGLGIAKLIFHTPTEGPLALLYLFSALTIIALLGLGLLISNLADTQQQAMFVAWFFMIIFVLMSGLFTPIESMPLWARRITWFNPIAQLVAIVRLNMLKGATLAEVWPFLRHLVLLGLGYGALAVFFFRKRNG